MDSEAFHQLVQESYSKELKGVDLQLNEHIPRVVKCYEEAFANEGLSFNKTRPARLFVSKVAENPDDFLSQATKDRFTKLFDTVKQRLEKIRARGAESFL